MKSLTIRIRNQNVYWESSLTRYSSTLKQLQKDSLSKMSIVSCQLPLIYIHIFHTDPNFIFLCLSFLLIVICDRDEISGISILFLYNRDSNSTILFIIQGTCPDVWLKYSLNTVMENSLMVRYFHCGGGYSIYAESSPWLLQIAKYVFNMPVEIFLSYILWIFWTKLDAI